MKRKVLLSAVLAGTLLGTCLQSKAQTTMTYFYNEDHYARTISPLPGGNGDYVSSETVRLGSDEAVHISWYNQAGNLLNSFYIDESGINDQNVNIIGVSPYKFILVCNHDDIAMQQVSVKLIFADVFGGIGQQQLFSPNHPSYNSIMAMDGKWDQNLQQVVVCGTTFKQYLNSDVDSKEAFVFTTDPSFNALNMRFFESNSGGGNADYDIATRVVLNSTGRYYVTGSENIYESSTGAYTMGIRNMLIDPFSLSPGWSVPLACYGYGSQNGVDMAEGPSGEFVTLVNADDVGLWGIIRIDPSSGNTLFGRFESPFEKAWGFNIHLGNNPKELVVTGMQNRTIGNCGQRDQEADPFHFTLDLSSFPAGTVNRIEYLTAVGNNNGTADYWSDGGIYAMQNSYPLPVYLNQFIKREKPGRPFGALAPIFDPSSTVLNTKYLDVDPNGKNGCKDINCLRNLDYRPEDPAYTSESDFDKLPFMNNPQPYSNGYYPYAKKDCNSGYFKTASASTAALNTSANAKVYPNPVINDLSIDLSADMTGKTTVSILDMSGRKVATAYEGIGAGSKISYQLPKQVANGIYLVQIVSEGRKTQTEKITVSR